LSPENKLFLQECENKTGFNFTKIINDWGDKCRNPTESTSEIVEFQTCVFHSQYPSNSDFCKCRKEGYWRTIRTKECVACALYKVLELPLMAMEKLKEHHSKYLQDIRALKNEKKTLMAEVQKLRSTTEAGLLKKIEELDDNFRRVQDVLRYKTQECEELEAEVKKRKPIEEMPAPPLQKVEQSPQIVKRTVEEKKTIEEYLPSPQVKIPSQLFLCRKTKEMVSVDDVCKKTCPTFTECPDYQEIIVKKAIRNQ
jgi:hypothetical protein